MSSLILVFRLAASGPWHAKHLSERIGRMSRLNSSPWPGRRPGSRKADAQNKAVSLRPAARPPALPVVPGDILVSRSLFGRKQAFVCPRARVVTFYLIGSEQRKMALLERRHKKT